MEMSLKKFMIERSIPDVGSLDADQLAGAAAKSNDALCHIGAKDIQWVQSYVAGDKTFCVYLASDEQAIRKHAELSGFPATKITEIMETIDPATAG
jgi:Nickel responsive protein SCO4226-like